MEAPPRMRRRLEPPESLSHEATPGRPRPGSGRGIPARACRRTGWRRWRGRSPGRIDPTLRGRANDIVWRVRFRDAEGGPEWLRVLLMLEFQSGIDWFMALRVQGYAVRLYESLWRERRPGRGDRLPPVLAVVIYNGKSRWWASTAMAGLIGEGTA